MTSVRPAILAALMAVGASTLGACASIPGLSAMELNREQANQGGATFREAHLIMEMLHDSARVTSLDLVELNPFLDERGRTAKLMVDLAASLMGRSVLDRPTRSY